MDQYNQALRDNVHPAEWQNPSPAARYNLVVLGAGTAGLVAAAGAAGLGAKVALVERGLMGGDCLNVGCVPSKAVLRAARAAAAARASDELGVLTGRVEVDFAQVMQRMRRLRAGISPHDSAHRFTALGVDVFLGTGRFVSRDCLEVQNHRLRFAKAVIATGARAAVPAIPGLSESGFLTNETVFNLTELPRRLAVIGGGPIGTELAQAFARLGSKVVQIEKAGRILSKDDPDAVAIVQQSLARDGVQHLFDTEVLKVEQDGDEKRLLARTAGQTQTVVADQIIVAVGRIPNVESLQLEAAGVDFDTRAGVAVNDRLQTANSRIFAAGDVCSRYRFTHAADFMARLVIRNALFFGRSKLSSLVIPWCTYTDPELAHIGLTARDAQQQGIAIDTYDQPLSAVDRAVLDQESEGFVRVHTRRGTDRIVGVTIVAGHAGDLIGEASLAMTNGLGLKQIANTIHPYPTQAEALRKIGDAYNRTRLTPRIKSLMDVLLRWLR